jgi:hypothetical protein
MRLGSRKLQKIIKMNARVVATMLRFLSSLLAPPAPLTSLTASSSPLVPHIDDLTCVRLINIVLETAGTSLGTHPCLVSVLEGHLSKYLLHNSETEELAILRVVFNLFNPIKSEQKELALESLLEVCRDARFVYQL